MWTHTQSRSLPVLIVGIVSIILALNGGPSCSLALESRRLLHNDQSPGQVGGRYKLLHWSNPQAPHYIAEVSYVDRFKAAVQSGNERVAALKCGAPSPSPGTYPAPSPGPSGSFESPLYNLVYEYAMEITIGTPPHTFSGIADTGSDLVWVQCAACDYCANQTGPLYDPLKSSTYTNMGCSDPLCDPALDSCSTNNTCIYQYTYGSGETDGDKAYETVTITSTTGKKTTSPKFAFGCDLETYVNLGGADGLIGLGKGNLSFTTQLASLYNNKFSYCLVSIYDSNTTGSLLLFGDAAVPKVPTSYTPMVTNPDASYYGTPTFYYISLTGIKVNGKLIDIPAGTFDIQPDGTGGVISDSGTTLTYIATDGYTPLQNELTSLITYPVSPNATTIGLDLCYDVAGVDNPIFPNVTIVFEGFELELPSQNAFIGGPIFASYGSSNTYCSAFADGQGTMSIFGNIMQQNFQVLYDRDAQVFGYAQVQCDKL